MKVKKGLSIFFAVIMISLLFAGCGGKNDEPIAEGGSGVGQQSNINHSEQGGENGELNAANGYGAGQQSGSALMGEQFFDDAVFVGDSVSLGFRNYVKNQRNNGKECLGKCDFLVAGNMGYANSLYKVGSEYSVRPSYNGEKVSVWDGVAISGAKKVFIMLGLNDFCIYTHEECMSNAKELVDRIVERNPGVSIYIQSVTPVTSAKEHGRFTNDNIDAFNAGLKQLCTENGWMYVDVASVMKNGNNAFKTDYCNDNDSDGQGVHMGFSGSEVWVDYLMKCFVYAH